MKKLASKIFLALALSACALAPRAQAQLTATYNSNMLTAPVVCQHTATNLAVTLFNTNRIWQGRNLGIAMSFWGGNASNNGAIGFQFAVLTRGAAGTNAPMTTTRPFTITSAVNGVTPVVDWAVLPSYTVGPADALVLVGITNASVNINASYASGSVTVSNLWLQTDTRP
jgi:hypothetical protein